jgi:hypothetical protein
MDNLPLKSWSNRLKRIESEIQTIISKHKVPNQNKWKNEPLMKILTDVKWTLDDAVYSLVYFKQQQPGFWSSK